MAARQVASIMEILMGRPALETWPSSLIHWRNSKASQKQKESTKPTYQEIHGACVMPESGLNGHIPIRCLETYFREVRIRTDAKEARGRMERNAAQVNSGEGIDGLSSSDWYAEVEETECRRVRAAMFGDGGLDVLYESETEKIKRIRRVVTLVTMISRIMGKERKYD